MRSESPSNSFMLRTSAAKACVSISGSVQSLPLGHCGITTTKGKLPACSRIAWASPTGLKQPILPTFSSAVQKQDYGPLFMFIPVVRNKDLVAIGFAAHGDGAVKEAGFLLASEC